MNKVDKQHKELIQKILNNGVKKMDRTKTGTLSIFGHQMRYNMNEGFPLLTLRKIHTKSLIHEMLWFLGAYDEKYEKFGNCNIRYLIDKSVTYWSDWPYKKYLELTEYRPELPHFTMKEFEAKILLDDDFAIEFGSIGKGYGRQWTNFGGDVIKNKKPDGSFDFIVKPGINQIDNIIHLLKKDPDSRRIMLMAWKPDEIDEVLLPPCHYSFQIYTTKMNMDERFYQFNKWINENNIEIGTRKITDFNFPERKISLMMNQRSQDLYLGGPFNTAQYALLLHMIGQVVNMIPDELIINIGDSHLYLNSIDAATKLLERSSYELPKIKLNKDIKNIYDFRYEDIEIIGYESHPNIKVDVAV